MPYPQMYPNLLNVQRHCGNLLSSIMKNQIPGITDCFELFNHGAKLFPFGWVDKADAGET